MKLRSTGFSEATLALERYRLFLIGVGSMDGLLEAFDPFIRRVVRRFAFATTEEDALYSSVLMRWWRCFTTYVIPSHHPALFWGAFRRIGIRLCWNAVLKDTLVRDRWRAEIRRNCGPFRLDARPLSSARSAEIRMMLDELPRLIEQEVLRTVRYRKRLAAVSYVCRALCAGNVPTRRYVLALGISDPEFFYDVVRVNIRRALLTLSPAMWAPGGMRWHHARYRCATGRRRAGSAEARAIAGG